MNGKIYIFISKYKTIKNKIEVNNEKTKKKVNLPKKEKNKKKDLILVYL